MWCSVMCWQIGCLHFPVTTQATLISVNFCYSLSEIYSLPALRSNALLHTENLFCAYKCACILWKNLHCMVFDVFLYIYYWWFTRILLTIWNQSFKFNSNKSPNWCINFSIYYPDSCLQLNKFREFSRPSSWAQWLQWQPLVLPSYRGDSRGVFVTCTMMHGFTNLKFYI